MKFTQLMTVAAIASPLVGGTDPAAAQTGKAAPTARKPGLRKAPAGTAAQKTAAPSRPAAEWVPAPKPAPAAEKPEAYVLRGPPNIPMLVREKRATLTHTDLDEGAAEQ